MINPTSTNQTAPLPTIDRESTPPDGTPGVDRARPDLDAILASAERPGRRRWPFLLIGAAAGAMLALAGTASLGDDDEQAATSQAAVTRATATVGQQDLREEIEWAGILGYGEPVSIAGPTGVVTWSSEVGTDVDRGDLVAIVGDQPVVVFFGSTPLWRPLAVGDVGADVRQVEANLAALGYDPDLTVDIDDEFTANTAAMVERWQEDLGIEPTGEIEPTDVVILDGPSTIVSSAATGSQAVGSVATAAPRSSVTDVVAAIDGTVTDLATIGTTVEHGSVLYRVDDVPVVALAPADPVAEALLDPTFTDLELEEALVVGGHDPDGELTVDGVLTEATTAAVERWQRASGLPVTGLGDPGLFTPVIDGHAVERHGLGEQDVVSTGGPVLATSRSQLSVSVVVDVAEADEFAVDQEVSVEAADGSTLDGVVTDIGAVTPAANAQDSPTVEITIDIEAGADVSLIEGPVTVVSAGEEILGATVVPTRALLALAEGGFAVEKLAGDDQTRLIAVEIGAFADGVVELVAGDLQPGDEIVVPG